MAKPLAVLWPLDGQGPALYLRPGDKISVVKGEVTHVANGYFYVAAKGLPRGSVAAKISVRGASVFIEDRTTNAAIVVHRGRRVFRGKALFAQEISLRDGDIVRFGSRVYQFNRGKKVPLS